MNDDTNPDTTLEAMTDTQVLQAALDAQQQGALLYITAILLQLVGDENELHMSAAHMESAYSYTLEIGDLPDNGLALRVRQKPAKLDPDGPLPSTVDMTTPLVLSTDRPLVRVNQSVVLLDASGEPNQ